MESCAARAVPALAGRYVSWSQVSRPMVPPRSFSSCIRARSASIPRWPRPASLRCAPAREQWSGGDIRGLRRQGPLRHVALRWPASSAPCSTPRTRQAFLRFLAQTTYEVYPRRVPPDWTPFRATGRELGPAPGRALPRGNRPRPGAGRQGEAGPGPRPLARSTRCAHRSSTGSARSSTRTGALRAGQLWAELDVTPQTGRRDAAPDRFRRRFLDVENWLKKTCRRSEPVGWLIGPSAARRTSEGLVLRDAGHRGQLLRPYR